MTGILVRDNIEKSTSRWLRSIFRPADIGPSFFDEHTISEAADLIRFSLVNITKGNSPDNKLLSSVGSQVDCSSPESRGEVDAIRFFVEFVRDSLIDRAPDLPPGLTAEETLREAVHGSDDVTAAHVSDLAEKSDNWHPASVTDWYGMVSWSNDQRTYILAGSIIALYMIDSMVPNWE